MTLVDGKAIAERLYADLARRRERIGREVRLGVVAAAADPVIESFVSIKSREAKRLSVEIVRSELGREVTSKEVVDTVLELAPKVDGVIVQLPLPKTSDTNAALSAIPDDKDVDAISTATGEHVLEAPVALAIVEILRDYGIDPKGKRTIVLGAGRLVGTPSAQLLKKLGADVSMVTLDHGSMKDLKAADIVVCGVGDPGLVRPEHLKPGVVLIDAGASEQSGEVVGDCDPACAKVASVFTPVPGGVGPVAVAMIFKNLFDLVERSK